MKVDLKTTHGLKGKAVEYLEGALIVLNDDHTNYHVNKIIRATIILTKQISELSSKEYVGRLVHEDSKKKIEARNFPLQVKTALLNIVDTLYKNRVYNNSNHLRK